METTDTQSTRKAYPSDPREAEWAILEPLVPQRLARWRSTYSVSLMPSLASSTWRPC